MREKTFNNTPKGRSEIPDKSGAYELLDKRGKIIPNGYGETNNLRRRVKEAHYDKTKTFSYIKIRTGIFKKRIKDLNEWLIDKKKEYEEIALNSISDSYGIKYMAKSNAMKEVLNYINETEKH